VTCEGTFVLTPTSTLPANDAEPSPAADAGADADDVAATTDVTALVEDDADGFEGSDVDDNNDRAVALSSIISVDDDTCAEACST